MKTLTIKQNIVEDLHSDESKLKFANAIIALLSGSKMVCDGKFANVLRKGLNTDIPDPMEGAPGFDSSNMVAPEFRRYSLLRGGYVPVGFDGLDCGYSGYKYRHLNTLSESEFEVFWRVAVAKLKQNEGKRDYAKFLKYLCDIYSWYFRHNFYPEKEG